MVIVFNPSLFLQRRAAAGPERDGRDDRGDEDGGQEGRPHKARHTQVSNLSNSAQFESNFYDSSHKKFELNYNFSSDESLFLTHLQSLSVTVTVLRNQKSVTAAVLSL